MERNRVLRAKKYARRVFKVGHSYAITIPYSFLRVLGIRRSDFVIVRLEGQEIVVSKWEKIL